MVFYFTLASAPHLLCYVGRDKVENEDLIKWGWPEDIWFHVDAHSSAHIYLRLGQGQTIDDLTPEIIEEAAQLTKANSIAGNKLPNIKVVYTPWANLKKSADMDVGQVGFHVNKEVRSVVVDKRKNGVINALEKTRLEKYPNLEQDKADRDREETLAKKMTLVNAKETARKELVEAKKIAKERDYSLLEDSSLMTGNAGNNEDLEDDFM
eukprot:NODE_1578_length_906_cov_104.378063_g1230_i0.p1 GENE.NODE_1578_length_906_cov_104.378063_g1230_i0~~NODE_1578_length_906_cov_104.378063_g1230_i0.p1  ORF type:complete len:230 (-),score=82.60 NODE_1578_length_906_cov_104.378063_g1230_i0:217-843(-)